MWVLLDNYDSFTHILHHYLLLTGHECQVIRNDAISVPELAALAPDRLILSPGPQTPMQAGITMEAIAHFHDRIPILGVCLGHQALGMYFGAELICMSEPMHGRYSSVHHDGHPLFAGIASDFEVMRYHSLALDMSRSTGLECIARSVDDDTCMALVHKTLPLTGIQFHPESIGTPDGKRILDNWAANFSGSKSW